MIPSSSSWSATLYHLFAALTHLSGMHTRNTRYGQQDGGVSRMTRVGVRTVRDEPMVLANAHLEREHPAEGTVAAPADEAPHRRHEPANNEGQRYIYPGRALLGGAASGGKEGYEVT